MTKEREDVILEAVLEVKSEVGELRGEVKRVLGLEKRVRALEVARAARQGAGSVRKTFGDRAWEIVKLALAAVLGGYVGKKM
jgi:hypothetical protein